MPSATPFTSSVQRGLRERCALLGAVAKLRLACLGHKSIETKRQLLVEACTTLGSGLVNQWMAEDDIHNNYNTTTTSSSASNNHRSPTKGTSQPCLSSHSSHSSSALPITFRFTNEINATSKIALEHLLALFHLGILESVDPFFADSGIARLHKALGVCRLGGVTPLRETPIGSLVESHISDLLGKYRSQTILTLLDQSCELIFLFLNCFELQVFFCLHRIRLR